MENEMKKESKYSQTFHEWTLLESGVNVSPLTESFRMGKEYKPRQLNHALQWDRGNRVFGSLFLTYIEKTLHRYSKPYFFALNIRHHQSIS